MKDLVHTMVTDKQAFDLIKKAESKKKFSSVLGFVGGGLIGWPVGTQIGGGDPNWTLAAIGGGLVAIGIPISLGVNKKTKQAVEVYNASLDATSSNEFKPEVKIIANGNGFGLSMNF